VSPERIRRSRSVVGEGEMEAVRRVMDAAYFAMGPEVQAFEQELAAFLGGEGRQVGCVTTGTAALQLALEACGVGPGDEVLVPTYTFVASFQAVAATGATPVACEVELETLFLDVEDAARRVTTRTKAIMPVHFASLCGDLPGVYELARRNGLRVVEDAAQAFGCRYQGQRVGATGDVVCFSFDGAKTITSGEGGAVVTADTEVAEHVRDARLLGVQRDTEQRFARDRTWEFDVVVRGYRHHMSDLMAAIGRVQLARFAEFAAARVRIAQHYDELLGDLSEVRRLPFDFETVVPWCYLIFVPAERRSGVLAALESAGAEASVQYKPNHLLTVFGGGSASFPVAERAYREVIGLPIHPEVTPDQQQRVADAVRSGLGGDAETRARSFR
jgi:dTDP-4-amino-4,6-dideoxygalactose transaminase